MADSRNKIIIVLLALTAVFNFLFWGEKLALNLFIYVLLLAAAAVVFNKDSVKNPKVIAVFLAVLYLGCMVVYNNSIFSIFACIAGFIVLNGLIHQPRLRTIISAVLTSLGSFILFPYNAVEEIKYNSRRHRYFAKFLKASKLALLPVLIFCIFYAIYAYSNPIFNDYSNSFWDEIRKFLNRIFIDYPPERIIFIFFGLFIVTGVLFNHGIKVFLKIDESFLNTLIRDKYRKLTSRIGVRADYPKAFKNLFRFKMKSLLTEHKIGIILLAMVNVLILILNIIDVSFVWFGFDSSRVDNLAYFVHEGTGYLIFSILLSMAILLFFFKGNLNFYSGNFILKFLAYLWIIQNGIMAISVMLRNYYYINYYYALSYKRIGVMIFLLLVFTGLVTMFIKIYKKKTLFYLLKVNSIAVFAVMILMGSLSWDYHIAKFNLQNPDKSAIDVSYLFTLSDEVLPILDGNKNLLNSEFMFREGFRRYIQNGLIELKYREKKFFEDREQYSWLSWNYSDFKTEEYFKNNNIERSSR
jgi:hypothetical protein